VVSRSQEATAIGALVGEDHRLGKVNVFYLITHIIGKKGGFGFLQKRQGTKPEASKKKKRGKNQPQASKGDKERMFPSRVIGQPGALT